MQPSSQQPLYSAGLGFSSLNFDVSANLGLQPSFSSQTLLSSQGSASLPGADLNSPELFKQNIQLAQDQVLRVQSLASNALAGIEHAYHPRTNPVQTTADIAALKQAIHVLVDFLRQTGVGALPLDPPSASSLAPAAPSASTATTTTTAGAGAAGAPAAGPAAGTDGQPAGGDEQLVAEATRAVQALYERQRRIQEGASVVANLLGAPELITGGLGAPSGAAAAAGSQGQQGQMGRR
ncbi:hypothetical protein C8Q73DRAFT_727477 [Cubamyces lactineus]|nr:hypothetical protein C8Q73DRAFT_727477 [Cubamyces lactineus]